MAWKLHPPEQSVLHPAEQTTAFQIKFIRQGNMLLSYLIGSWGLRTGSLRKSGDQFTSFSIIFVIHVSAFICSHFAWQMFQCTVSANECKMGVCWGFVFIAGKHSIGHVAGQTSRIILLLWAIMKSLSYCFEDRKLLYASCSGDTIHNIFLHQSCHRDFNYAGLGGVCCNPTVYSVGISIPYITHLISWPKGFNIQDCVYNKPSSLQSTPSWIEINNWLKGQSNHGLCCRDPEWHEQNAAEHKPGMLAHTHSLITATEEAWKQLQPRQGSGQHTARRTMWELVDGRSNVFN